VTSSSSSLVTACKVGAGSTTAASKVSHRPGEEYEGKHHTHFQHSTSARTSQFLHHIPRTEQVLANYHSNTSSKTSWRPSEAQGQVWRRGTSRSSQEEKGKLKPGVSQEVKDKPQPSQEKQVSINSQQQQLYTAPLLHNYRQR
jgi:hypothetical protein